VKVFLSWSGEKSHKVALVFRDWFPSVIQSLVPYVSSEDIDKGTRWSTDIAKELEDSSFGILCVTKENINAPWLTFEAGALSKTMDKSFVSPFLFDIKRSEVDGPILQFQSTIFTEDDVLKLIKTLNKACGEDKLSDERLDKAFSVWWPTLEDELNKLKEVPDESTDQSKSVGTSSIGNSEILEEILDLTRLNQKLLRNPDNATVKAIHEISKNLQMTLSMMENERHVQTKRKRRFRPGMIEELMHSAPKMAGKYIAFQMVVSMFKEDFPWLYDAGMDVVKTLKADTSFEEKDAAVSEFMELVEFSFEHPIMREMSLPDKEQYMMLRELPYMLKHSLKFDN
jgi:hypothetical protein